MPKHDEATEGVALKLPKFDPRPNGVAVKGTADASDQSESESTAKSATPKKES